MKRIEGVISEISTFVVYVEVEDDATDSEIEDALHDEALGRREVRGSTIEVDTWKEV